MRAAEEAAWRSVFKPHAIILTEHTRPTQITSAAICGADRKLRIDFEPGSNRISCIRQALDQVRRRTPIQFYGRAIGVIVNYSPDDAVHFDLTGNALEVLPAAYRPGELTVSIGGRPVPRDALEANLLGEQYNRIMIGTGISDPLQTGWVTPGAYAGRIGLALWGRYETCQVSLRTVDDDDGGWTLHLDWDEPERD